MMACRDLQRSVAAQIDRGHKHGGGGCQAAVQHPDPRRRECCHRRVPDTGSRQAAVPSDRDSQLPAGRSGFVRQPRGECRGDPPDRLVGELNGLSLDAVHRHTSYIGSAFEPFPLVPQHADSSHRMPTGILFHIFEVPLIIPHRGGFCNRLGGYFRLPGRTRK